MSTHSGDLADLSVRTAHQALEAGRATTYWQMHGDCPLCGASRGTPCNTAAGNLARVAHKARPFSRPPAGGDSG